MTEKDLDVAIEKCERIMEMDTRTMQNPVSENGWIFEKVYELLQYLRQFQYVSDTNVGDIISRQAAISEIMEDIKDRSLHDDPATPEDYAEGYDEGIRNAAAIVLQMPSAQLAQDLPKGCTDTDTLPSAQPVEDAIAMCGECDAWNQYKNYPQGWIPCSVMLPENDGVYLVTLRAITQLQKACAKIDIARFDGKWHKAYPVVAWMPLPKPWEGKEE